MQLLNNIISMSDWTMKNVIQSNHRRIETGIDDTKIFNYLLNLHIIYECVNNI